jgi:hypothetical protein
MPADRVKTPVPVYGSVPPVAVTVTELPLPLHRIGAALAAAARSVGCVMVIDVFAVQPLSSVTVKVYVPAALLNVPMPVYGFCPPAAETVTVE